VGWIYLVKFLATLRYLVAVQLLWILFAELDMLLIRTTFRLLLLILCSLLDKFLFLISVIWNIRVVGLASVLSILYEVTINTSHSLWVKHQYFPFIMGLASVLHIYYGVSISTSHSLWG
jgi:hypothetical protein